MDGSFPGAEREGSVLRTVLTGTDQFVYVFDAERESCWWNDAVRARSGRTDAELKPLSASEFLETFVAPPDWPRAAAAIDRLEHTGELSVELAVGDGDGGERPYEFRGSVVDTSDGMVFLLLAHEITDRLEHERKVGQLRRCTLDLMATTTRSESANIAATAANEVLDAPLSGVFFPNSSDDAMVLAAAPENFTESFDTEPRYERGAPDGSRSALVWRVFDSGEPMTLEDSADTPELGDSPARSAIIYPLAEHGILVVSSPEPGVFDDTDEALVDILAASLRASLDRVDREARLREQNERLDEFASLLSHDLRNPLSVAKGHLELARDAAEPTSNLDAVERSLDRIESLTEDLLTLAREGKAAVDTQQIDLVALSKSCWMGVQTGEATLDVELDEVVPADESRLRQLFENLFRNAVEHGFGGQSASRPPAVTVGRLDDGEGFFVADDGEGIPANEREDVLSAGYSTVTSGTGLGLSIVAEVAQAHGWSVAITESVGGGARFEFRGVEWL